MSPAHLYSLITLAMGSILLMGWFYCTAANPRSRKLLLKSFGFFVVPIGVALTVPDDVLQFPLALWLVVLVEESLKATAAATESKSMNRFWLVSLFGIWELTLAKTMWGIEQVVTLSALTSAQAIGVALSGVITVLMHAVTAELYAFRFGGRLAAAFAATLVFHVGFNETVTFIGTSLGFTIGTGLLLVLPLALLFMKLWPKRLAVAPLGEGPSGAQGDVERSHDAGGPQR
jgi:hypothetical protein